MQFNEIMALEPMFPCLARKSAPSLYSLSSREYTRILANFIKSTKSNLEKAIKKVRKYTRQNLPAQVLTDLLGSLIPGQGLDRLADKWTFPCVESHGRLQCRVHWECQMVFHNIDKLILVLFSEDISHLNLNLKRVKIDIYHDLLNSLNSVVSKLPYRLFLNLCSLVICGGTVHSDDLDTKVEELCTLLRESATKLEHLHLPVASNVALRAVSDMASLFHLQADRTKNFDRRGLYHLCHPQSSSRYKLKVLHLGVYRHKHFEKQDVAEFLHCMQGLQEFSLLDNERALVRLDGSRSRGEKVLVYSVFKRAIRDSELSSNPSFTSKLKHISVVDRSLKPHYLLESAPQLSGLSLDWQEELSFPPFNRFTAGWFAEMIQGQSWAKLSSSLTRLDITFPATYSPNSYSLPLQDYTRLIQSLHNLERLRLVGAGLGGPIPIMQTLFYCPKLKDLVLEKCPVHVPDNYEVIDQKFVSHSLLRFKFLGELSSLMVHDFMMRGIGNYMPALRELEVQPQTVLGYAGLRPDQVRELTVLPHLERLSLPLSIRECIMNLPLVIYVLREFPSLRHLTLSWGMWCQSYDIGKRKIAYMMTWLLNTLGAENANINLQLSYKQHPLEFTNPCGPQYYY